MVGIWDLNMSHCARVSIHPSAVQIGQPRLTIQSWSKSRVTGNGLRFFGVILAWPGLHHDFRSVWDFVGRKTDSEEGEEVTTLTNCHLSITTVVCSAIEFHLQVLGD